MRRSASWRDGRVVPEGACGGFLAWSGAMLSAGTVAAQPPGPTFTDVTTSSGLIASHQPGGALLFAPSVIADLIGPVVCGDFNNDGWQDIFIVSSGAVPDRLFISNGDWTFTNRAAEWGVAVSHMGLSACAGDFDADGFVDLYVMSAGLTGQPMTKGRHRLYRNLGGAAFEEVALSAGVQQASPIMADGLGCAFGDYNLDGHLDLMVAGYFLPGQGNRLFRNNGNGTFTDVTVAAGLSPMPIHGFSPRFIDMDGDRYPEILMAADFHTSRYFVNNRNGTFSNQTVMSGTGTDDNGMGHAVADFDGDGLLDWFVTSIWAVGSPETPGTGNRHYRQYKPHRYTDVAAATGTLNGNWGWGVSAVDLDHDGWVDLVQTNGWHTSAQFQNQPTRVWMNDGGGSFTDIAATSGLWHTLSGRGLLAVDLDNDGDRDIVILASKGPLRVYRNDLIQPGVPVPPGAAWIRIEVRRVPPTRVAPHGIGTRIRVRTGEFWQQRTIEGGTNYQSQDELAAHFGLGAAAVIDELRLEWTDGTVTLLRDVSVNQRLTIDAGRRADLDRNGMVDGADLGVLLAAWGAIDAADARDLNSDGVVDGFDLGLLLVSWG